MGQLDWVELYFSSTGRLARGPFLLAAAVLLVLWTLFEVLVEGHPTLRLLTGWAAYPLLVFTGACILSKRLHDRGHTGWLAALLIVALIAIWPVPHTFFDFLFALAVVWAAVELGVLPGEQGANRYGQNPLKTA